MDIKRGQVIYVNLDGAGSVQKGTRPCVVVQNDTGNKYSTTTIIVPFTEKPKKWILTHVYFERTGSTNCALCEQIHTIDKMQIKEVSDEILPNEVMELIDRALMISLGMYDKDATKIKESSRLDK